MRIFFIDVDNTLIFGDKFPAENREAIKKARQEGHLVIINTGRGREYVPWHLLDGIEYDGIIAGIGSYVEFQGKQVYCNPIPAQNCLKLYDLFAKNGKWNKYEGINQTFFQNFEDGKRKIITKKEQAIEYCSSEPILKFTCGLLNQEEIDLLSHDFRILSYGYYSEGTSKGESKGNGIRRLLKYLDKSPEDCVALGDSKNDLEMFEICGNSAAMDNAEPDIKRICTYNARHAVYGGVADAITYFTK